MAQRKRYKTMEDVLPEAIARAKAGMHPAATKAKEALERSGVAGAMAGGVRGTLAPHEIDNSRPGGDHMQEQHVGAQQPSLVPKGGVVSDLGVRANNVAGNERAGTSFRDFYDAKGKEFHVYEDGTKIGVKPRSDATLLTSFLANQQAMSPHPPASGQPAPAGPQDTAGQSPDAADPQRTALAQLAELVAQQRAAQQAHPELDPERKRRRPKPAAMSAAAKAYGMPTAAI